MYNGAKNIQNEILTINDGMNEWMIMNGYKYAKIDILL